MLKYGDIPVLLKKDVGYIDSTSGNLTTTSWTYRAYKCKKDDIIKISLTLGEEIGSNICLTYAIYSSVNEYTENTVLVKGPKWEETATELNNTISIPDGAKSIVFCYKNISSFNIVKLQTRDDVINTYLSKTNKSVI